MKFVVKILDRIGLIFETFLEFFVIFFYQNGICVKKESVSDHGCHETE